MIYIVYQKIDFKTIYLTCIALFFILYINILFYNLKSIWAKYGLRAKYFK